MRPRLLSALLAVAIFTAGVSAALPTFWQVSTEAEFLRGEVENLSIDSYGRLTLGPTSTPVYDSSAPFIWTAVTLADGTVYAGSGNEGQVYRVDASGKGSVFFDSEELEVHAIAPVPTGGIYVGTSPQGKIYKVDPTGKAAVFFDPDDRYIWSLVVDPGGNVFAATGDKGVIYRITPDGKGTPFYETKATHAMTLAFDGQGRLLAGTESPGRVFRIDASGKPFVILDSSFNEIRTLRVDRNGMIYAIAVSSRPGSGSGSTSSAPSSDSSSTPTAVVSVSAEVTAIGLAEPSGSGPPPQQTPRSTGPVTGAIYRISPDGVWDLLWELREDTPYDIAFESNGTLLVATGNKGKIYRLAGEPFQPTLVVRANVQQVTAILPERDGRMLFATSNPGKLLRLSAARADRGTYTSDVRDATTVAAWGTIRWRSQAPAGTRVEIATRSGNTRTPDETWSDWTSAYSNQTGSAISSPRARYLQWRAILVGARGESPLLTSVSAAYLPRNLRPRVTGITIHPPGTVFQRPFPTDPEIAGFDGELPDRRNAAATAAGSPSLGRRVYQKGLLTFVWRAEDDNKDDLTFDVLYRREGETSWKTLKRAVVDPIMVWDTTSVPNGSYLLRIVASDAASNSPSTALTGALESTAFDVDNTPPEINMSSVRRDGARLVLEFEVRDEYSAVQRADYSLDGDRWQTIYPKDGIADSRVEQFELVLEGEAAARGVIVRATDALNNSASARGEASVPAAGSGRR